MSSQESWEQQLQHIGSEHDRELIQRLSKEDPDLADELRANLIQAHLDDIELQNVSPALHKKLYAIADAAPRKQFAPTWTAWIGVAAVLVIAVLLKPWQTSQPSADDIALARQQLATAFFYLHKTADKTASYTEQSIALGVQTAMKSTPFGETDNDAIEL